jgi:hypothetical protein
LKERVRATRLPPDFTVTPEMADWARREVPALIAAGRGSSETERFRDYWAAEGGQRARKVDWVKTWHNWMRRAADDLGGVPQQHRGAPQKTTTNDRVQQAIESGKRLQAMMDGGS